MLNKYLEDDFDSRLEKKDIEEFLKKMKRNSLTPIDIDCIYCGMSSAAQDAFLEGLKPSLSEEDYAVVLQHFKSLTFMDSNRAKTKAVQEHLAMQLYEQFDDVRKGMHKVLLRFTTCTIMEAVGEINIMLKRAGFVPIAENNCIGKKISSNNTPDWFSDYDFVFETKLLGTKAEIREKLHAVGMDFEFVE